MVVAVACPGQGLVVHSAQPCVPLRPSAKGLMWQSFEWRHPCAPTGYRWAQVLVPSVPSILPYRSPGALTMSAFSECAML